MFARRLLLPLRVLRRAFHCGVCKDENFKLDLVCHQCGKIVPEDLISQKTPFELFGM